MAIALPALLALAQACAPGVAPTTLLSVVRVESAFDRLTIGVNAHPHQTLHPTTSAQAIRQARALLARGADIDLGLAQINARNLSSLGLSVDDAFDPCRNLAAEGRILTDDFVAAQRAAAGPQAALRVALSRYNTGDAARGFATGYVARVVHAASILVPAITAPISKEGLGSALPSKDTLDVFSNPDLTPVVFGVRQRPLSITAGE